MARQNAWSDKPFKQLGTRLKQAREKIKETLAEVSGSVEIDIETLKHIETGDRRPNEETLLLLINHFDFTDDDATDLWELAGYGSPKLDGIETVKSLAAIIPIDNRIVYTDLVHVMVNNYGVVMNFMQNSGASNQPLTVARLGMSKEHARSVLDMLQKTLTQAGETRKPKVITARAKKQKTDKN